MVMSGRRGFAERMADRIKHIHIGKRIYKTSIAACLAYGIAQLLQTYSPSYAVFAVIITMQQTVYETVDSARNRVLGTIVGTVVGYLFAIVFSENIATIGIGIFLILSLCMDLGWSQACSMACFSFVTMLMMENPSIKESLYCLVDTGIGIGVSFLVNMVSRNGRMEEGVRRDLDVILRELLLYLKKNLYDYINWRMYDEELQAAQDRIREAFAKAKENAEKYEKESRFKKYDMEMFHAFEERYQILWEMFVHTVQIGINVSGSGGVNDNIKDFVIRIYVSYNTFLNQMKQEGLSGIGDQRLEELEGNIRHILEEMENIGMDGYHLKREEKREITNILFEFLNIIEGIQRLKRVGCVEE